MNNGLVVALVFVLFVLFVVSRGIRVVGVSPGTTYTDIHARGGDPDRPARVAERVPLRRVADPREIAEGIVWALSPAASYVTGTTIAVAGGLAG